MREREREGEGKGEKEGWNLQKWAFLEAMIRGCLGSVWEILLFGGNKGPKTEEKELIR